MLSLRIIEEAGLFFGIGQGAQLGNIEVIRREQGFFPANLVRRTFPVARQTRTDSLRSG
jgi:hypothetical protein